MRLKLPLKREARSECRRGSRLKLALPAAVASAIVVAACGGHHTNSAPAAPSNVVAVASEGNITITWNAVPGAVNYILYSAQQEGVTQTNFGTLTGGTREFGQTSPVNFTANDGDTWFFVVTAVGASGLQSADSQEVYASASPWPAAIVLEGAQNDAITGSMAKDAAGDLIAAWARQLPTSLYSIHAARYSVSTASWSAPVTVDDGTAYSNTPYVASRDDGTALAVWKQGNGSLNLIFANEFLPASGWGTPTRIVLDTSLSAIDPVVAVNTSAGGEGFAAWSQLVVTSGGITTDAIFGNFFPGAWGPGALISSTSQDSTVPAIGADALGGALMLYVDDGAVVATASTGGAAWQPALTLSITTAGATSPSIAVNAAGDAIAAWLEPSTLFPGFNAFGSLYRAGVWQHAALLSSANQNTLAPSVAIDASGNGVVLFAQQGPSSIVAQTVRVVDGAFTPPVQVSNNPSGDVQSVAVAVGTSSDAIAVWTQNIAIPDGIATLVYSSRYALVNSAWGPAVQAYPTGDNAHPSVVIGSAGTATVFWTAELVTSNGSAVMANSLPLQ